MQTKFNALKAAKVTTAAFLAVLVGGCTTIGKIYSSVHGDQFGNAFELPDQYQQQTHTELKMLESNSSEYLLGGDSSPTGRNDYISMKMFEIDREYFGFVGVLFAGDTGVVSAADFAQIGLSTAASAIPVMQTTKILSTVATGVGAGKSIYNQDLLKTQTLQAIRTQMDADRAKIKDTILFRMANCSLPTYPMGLVLSDLQAYAAAGTPESALVSILSSAAKAKQSSSSPTNTASASGTSGGSSPSDSNAKQVSVTGGVLTYSFKSTTQCPLAPKPVTPQKAKGKAPARSKK